MNAVSSAPAVESMPEPAECAGLYVHIPFCSAVCPYCDFAVQTGSAAQRAALVSLLRAEAALWETYGSGRSTRSISAAERLRCSPPVSWNRCSRRCGPGCRSGPMHGSSSRRTPRTSRRDGSASGVRSECLSSAWACSRSTTASSARSGVATTGMGARQRGRGESRGRFRHRLGGSDVRACPIRIPACGPRTSKSSSRSVPSTSRATSSRFTRVRRTDAGARAGQLTEMPMNAARRTSSRTRTPVSPDAGWAAYEVSNFARSSAAPLATQPEVLAACALPRSGALGPLVRRYARRWWNHRALVDYAQRIARGERAVEASESLDGEAFALEALMLGLAHRRGHRPAEGTGCGTASTCPR